MGTMTINVAVSSSEISNSNELIWAPILITNELRQTWSYLETATAMDSTSWIWLFLFYNLHLQWSPMLSPLESPISICNELHWTAMDKHLLEQIIPFLISNIQLQWTLMGSNYTHHWARKILISSWISNSKGKQLLIRLISYSSSIYNFNGLQCAPNISIFKLIIMIIFFCGLSITDGVFPL